MIKLLQLHPAFLLLLSSILLKFFQKRDEKLFKFCAVVLPILTLIKFCNFDPLHLIDLFGFELIPIRYNEYNKLLGITLLISHITACIYAISNKQFNEIILGNIYAAASIAALLAGDFISLFASLELMMIISSIIIFIGDHKNSKTASMRYFIMHLTAGVCVLSGIVFITDSGAAREIHALSLDVGSHLGSKYNLGNILLLLGCLINIGAPPFSAWITDSYPTATTSGTIFLSLYTTKIAAYCFIMLFPGWSLLIPIGFVTAIYGCIYAMLENNIRRIFCFQTIFQLGLILIGIGIGTPESIFASHLLIFAHILYNTLFLILAGAFIDNTKLEKCTDIVEINFDIKPLVVGGFVAILSLISFPYTGSFFAKVMLGDSIHHYNKILYVVYLALSSSIIISLPWRHLFNAIYNNTEHLNILTTFAIYLLSFITLSAGLVSISALSNSNNGAKLYEFTADHFANQQLLNYISIALAYIFYTNEHKTRHLLLTFDYFYRRVPWKNFSFLSLEHSPTNYTNTLKDKLVNLSLRIKYLANKIMVESQAITIASLSLIFIIIYLMHKIL